MYFLLAMKKGLQILFLLFSYVVWVSNVEIQRISFHDQQIMFLRPDFVRRPFLGPQEFMELHKTSPFNDTALKFQKWWWHATPIGGSFASFDNPEKWNWDLEMLT